MKRNQEERVLLAWEFTEEKLKNSQEREVLIVVVGISAVILAFISKTYVFALLLIIATITTLIISKRPPRIATFSIREHSLTIGGRVQSYSDVLYFNIIDDPGDRSRLVLRVENSIDGEIVVPLYDYNSDTVRSHLRSRGLREELALEPSIVDLIARYF